MSKSQMKTKSWEIVKEVLKIDRSLTLTNGYAGMYYQFIETFDGTESKARAYVNKLQKACPEVDEDAASFERIEYLYCEPGLCKYKRDEERIFKVIGMPDEIKDDIDYESLSKEELIKLIMERSKILK